MQKRLLELAASKKMSLEELLKDIVDFPNKYPQDVVTYVGSQNNVTAEFGMTGLSGLAGIGSSLLAPFKFDKEGKINTGVATGEGVLQGIAAGSSFGPIGAGVGGLLFGGISLLQAEKQKKEQAKAERELEKIENKHKMNVSNAILDAYPTEGVAGTPVFYKMGGVDKNMKVGYNMGGVQVPGGAVVPMATNVNKVVGNTHENGGIQINDNVEVEDEEVAFQDPNYGTTTWYSDTLKHSSGKTFAEVAEEIGKRKAKVESALNSPNNLVKNTAKRNLEKIEQELRELQQEQKSLQVEKGYNPNGQVMAEDGGIFSGDAGKVLPYLDNLTNAILTSRTPEIPTPRLYSAIPLETRFNVNPQLNQIQTNVDTANKAIMQSTSSSPIQRNAIIASGLAATQATNKVLGDKENIETELRNRNITNQQQVNNLNVDKLASTDMLKFQRLNEIQSRISQNVANLSEDAQFTLREDKLRDRDAAEMQLLKERYQQYGIWDRNMSGAFEDFMSGKITYDDFQRIINNISTRQKKDTTPLAPIGSILNRGLMGAGLEMRGKLPGTN